MIGANASYFHGKTIPPLAETTIKWPTQRQDDALHRNPGLRIAERFTTGIRRGLAWLIAASVIGIATLAVVNSASAQTVPIPKPAPKGRGGLEMSASDPQKGPMTTGATPAQPPNPVIPDPRRNLPANIFATFGATQKAPATKLSFYISSLKSLVGNFVQVNPALNTTKVDFFIQKPGKV